MIRVRVRGIYATALTKLLLDEGFFITNASKIIASRFSLPQSTEPPHVTVKDVDDPPGSLLVIGFPEAASQVIEALRSKIPEAVTWKSPVNLHSVAKAKVVEDAGRILVELPGGIKAKLRRGTPPEPGSEVVVTVVKAPIRPGDECFVEQKVRVTGFYAAVIIGEQGVTISEHIRSRERRAELLALASTATRKGYAVHWRSSAGQAPLEELSRELEELIKRAEQVKQAAEQGEQGFYEQGQAIAIIGLPRPAKRRMDALRGAVVPTITGHHEMKAAGQPLSDIVDYAEKALENNIATPDKLGEIATDYIISKMLDRGTVELLHVKVTGETIRLGRATITSALKKQDGYRITLRREVKTWGIYDGLGVEKEPGDYIITTIDTNAWHIKHDYYSRDGALKGTYININTPPELTPTTIMYYDLLVDVVKKPGSPPAIIDKEELDKALEKGIITEQLYEKALQEAYSCAGNKSPTNTTTT